jgi:hypothetical protein
MYELVFAAGAYLRGTGPERRHSVS